MKTRQWLEYYDINTETVREFLLMPDEVTEFKNLIERGFHEYDAFTRITGRTTDKAIFQKLVQEILLSQTKTPIKERKEI